VVHDAVGRGRATLVSLQQDQARTGNCSVKRLRICPQTWHAAVVSAPGAAGPSLADYVRRIEARDQATGRRRALMSTILWAR